MRRFALLILLALLAGAGAARADDNRAYGYGQLYIGAGISNDRVDDVTHTGVAFGDISKSSCKGFAGVRPLRVFAVEADYRDLGNTPATSSAARPARMRKAFAGYGCCSWRCRSHGSTSTARPGSPAGR